MQPDAAPGLPPAGLWKKALPRQDQATKQPEIEKKRSERAVVHDVQFRGRGRRTPLMLRLQREYEDLIAELDTLNASNAAWARGSSLYVRQMMALDQRRERMAAKLQEIGTQVALVATHDCDEHTSLSAASLCRDILDRLDDLKLGIS